MEILGEERACFRAQHRKQISGLTFCSEDSLSNKRHARDEVQRHTVRSSPNIRNAKFLYTVICYLQYNRFIFLVEGKSSVLTWFASHCYRNGATAWLSLRGMRPQDDDERHWNAKLAVTWPKAQRVLPTLKTGPGVYMSFFLWRQGILRRADLP